MDPEVRKALQTLQGLLDEGFITDAEFATRRAKIVDKATAVSAKPNSVFSRLGNAAPEAQHLWQRARRRAHRRHVFATDFPAQ